MGVAYWAVWVSGPLAHDSSLSDMLKCLAAIGLVNGLDLRHDVFYSTLRRTFMTETVPVSLNVPVSNATVVIAKECLMTPMPPSELLPRSNGNAVRSKNQVVTG